MRPRLLELRRGVPPLPRVAAVAIQRGPNGAFVYAIADDGSVGFGYENDRGVIRAIEDMVGRRYDETTYFTDYSRGFLIMHHPYCNGLAVLKKVPDFFRSQSELSPAR